MDKKNNNINAIYDDSVSSGAILKDVKKKLGKRINIDIDNISVEEKANTVINNCNKVKFVVVEDSKGHQFVEKYELEYELKK